LLNLGYQSANYGVHSIIKGGSDTDCQQTDL